MTMNEQYHSGYVSGRHTSGRGDGQSTQHLREVLHNLPSLSNEHLALVYQIVRREVEGRTDATGRPRASWALARDAW
jgi:hypothetical protein